jgi:L,D-peptidoglycan transpeptidase YkuD (ErfK/YbiS/YcfS/YnhG family)
VVSSIESDESTASSASVKMLATAREHPAMRAIVTSDGSFMFESGIFRAVLGRGGVRVDKREGDGATPLGLLPLRKVLYRPDRGTPPVCAVPVEVIAAHDGWCDDPTHPAYNRAVQLPIEASAEALWRDDPVYDIIGVLGWNDSPVRAGLGSAIFLHLARTNFAPTEGCVAMAPDDLRRVLEAGLTEILVTT